MLLSRGLVDETRIRLLMFSVKRFEWVGAVIVLTLSVTGVVNHLFIVDPSLMRSCSARMEYCSH